MPKTTSHSRQLGLGPDFDGKTYNRDLDHGRLTSSLGKVWDLMRDGVWRDLKTIANAVESSEAGVSARLRDLRKEKFAALYPTITVRSRRRPLASCWEYRVEVPVRYYE